MSVGGGERNRVGGETTPFKLSPIGLRSPGGWPGPRQAVKLAGLTLALVAAAYQVRLPVEIALGSGLLEALSVTGFHDAEGSFRWSRAESTIVLPDPGPALRGRVELSLSGFRPPGAMPPVLFVETGDRAHRFLPSRRVETLDVPVTTRGLWSSDIEIRLRSETFIPEEGDRRALGVRVHRVRWVPDGPLVAPGLPPLGQLAASLVVVFALLGLAIRLGVRYHRGRLLAAGVAVALGLGYAVARAHVATLTAPAAAFLAMALLASYASPALVELALQVVGGAARRWVATARWALGWPFLLVALTGVVALTVAYGARPSFSIDIGSGAETERLRRFSSFDGESGTTFRRALRGAELDLHDFGGGTQWVIEITASVADDVPRSLLLARAGGAEVRAELGGEWTTVSFAAPVPLAWDAGASIQFPSASEALGLRVDRVLVERGRTLPSPRVLLVVLGSAFLLGASFRAAGASKHASLAATWIMLAAQSWLTWTAPVLFVPFAGTLALVSAGTWIVAGLSAAGLDELQRRGLVPATPPLALAAANVGFLVWTAALLFPLYQGLHWVYHTSIAEEIWRGGFLTYYLPSPNNMLSREAQWGGIVVPYPCLYHTLAAPLAALPQPWFHGLQKIGLSLMLASMAVAGAWIAARLSGPQAAVYAAVLLVSLLPTFQLLGLAHLLTLFGCWTATAALTFIFLFFERLTERRVFWTATVILAFCFLSYTASLLFTGVSMVALAAIAARRRPLARALLGSTLLAGAAAFLLYYMHWAVPFLSESLPAILGPEADGPVPVGTRLMAIPRKLDYSFGSALWPLTGLAGIALLVKRSGAGARWVLVVWGGVLAFFSLLDVFFNFLLKHHYFAMVAVAVGVAGLLERGSRGRAVPRWLARAAIGLALYQGATAALRLAQDQLR